MMFEKFGIKGVQEMGYIGENIRRERIRSGLDQAELARELELDQTAISRFEKGSRRPSVDLLKRIAVVLDCEFSSLVENSEETEGEGGGTGSELASKSVAAHSARDFVQTLLAQNPQVKLQLRSLAEHQDELTPEDWQFLADHLTLAFGQVELLLKRGKAAGKQ